MSLEPFEWITIAEAAKRLGLVERQARRWADKLSADGRRQEETTPGRSRALIRLDLLENLVSGHLSGHMTGQPEPHAETPVEPEKNEPQSQTFQVPLQLAMTAQRDALERVISEQAARICDLQAALEHERGQSQRLTEALAREQTLRLLSAPTNTQVPDASVSTESPGEPPYSAPESDGRGGEGLKPPTEPILSRLRTFWQRHWY